MDAYAGVHVDISGTGDISETRRVVRDVAREIGFDSAATEELVLVVSELASNIVKHAREGRLTMRAVSAGHRRGLEVEAVDRGSGMPDPESAVVDGYSTADTLGFGLGAVRRLTDELSIRSVPGQRTVVSARRWLRQRDVPARDSSLDIGAATRAHPGMQGVNGDAFVICRAGTFVTVGVIDGVGHGQPAHIAANAARREVEARCHLSLREVFAQAESACHGTRGVAMALARFDCDRSTVQLASVGNVETRVFGMAESLRYAVRRGIVGLNAPVPAVTEQAWPERGVMCIYSDGVQSRWHEDMQSLVPMTATEAAALLLRRYSRETDDATIVVVKGRQL